MRSDQPRFLYTLLDPEYFESLERYRPSGEFRAVAEGHLGDGWTFTSGGFWSSCRPVNYKPRVQGWKIHVSATPSAAIETLDRVAPLLATGRTPFKFCSDPRMVRLSTSKNWPRQQAGKFITVYPRDTEHFVELIEQIHQATAGLRGPYILSDRPYRDSRVVYYRYGEHAGVARLRANGTRTRSIVSPTGEYVSDDRQAFYQLPEWVSDPFGGDTVPRASEDGVWLKDRRYRVTGALKYSSVGGIYSAEDTTTGEAVVIREARPMLSERRDMADGMWLLEKEARILQKLAGTGLLPRFVDLFGEWEHLFLVQEKLAGQSLWGYAIGFINDMERSRTAEERFGMMRETVRSLAAGLRALHEHHVVVRDLTKTNIFFTDDGRPKFIDFELAYETDRDDPVVAGFTTGYASPDQLRNRLPAPHDDHFALGALVLDMVAFTASGLPLNRPGVLASLELTLRDEGLPRELYDVVVGLTEPDPARRWTPEHAVRVLDAARVPPGAPAVDGDKSRPPSRPLPADAVVSELAETVDGIVDLVRGLLSFDRGDRLWPASGELFSTNPVSVQFGAAGTAFFLLRATGEVPAEVQDWIVERARPDLVPPGLYIGLGGVALLLLEVGRVAAAEEVLARSRNPELVREQPGLHVGAAGWGLANLHFWARTGKREYVEAARETAAFLMESARGNSAGAFWEASSTVPLGLGYGASGPALFLTLLNAASPDSSYLELAEKALDFEISHAQMVAGRPLWFPEINARVDAPKSPHMQYGSAGVGSALIRFHAATGEPRFREWADRCANSVSERMTNKLWFDYGLAGFGEFLLDMHHFVPDDGRYLANAFHVAQGLLPHRMPRPEGIAFPGSELLRISCDVGAGSAGIGLFLHRLLNPETPRLLMLDELLARPAIASRPARVERRPAYVAS